MRFSIVVLSLLLLLPAGCRRNQADRSSTLRADLVGAHHAVTTSSPEAQRYFDQGLTLYYAFNHEAAIASFRSAAAIDPACAMAYWGEAISAGPNINNPTMDSAAAKSAWEASRQATKLAGSASRMEQDLIRALTARYIWPQPTERKSLDQAYADSMRRVWNTYRDDSDVGALFADALLNLRPWDLWLPDGTPRPETPEVVSTLEEVLRRAPGHIGACHFYIHTMEASPTPERALAAADSLRGRVSGAGHLLHMPAHIDLRIGHYENAVDANLKGIASDSLWNQKGFYTLYRAHNYHFLAYAAMFDGRRELSLRAADGLIAQVPIETVRQMPDFLDGFLAAPIHVKARFGMWDNLLREPEPPSDLFVTRAFWHYGRTVAFSALGRVREAGIEFDSLKAACDRVPESRLIGNNSARTVLQIGLPMAEGELEYRRGHHKRAFALLKLAVQRDDSLHYDEPWGWMMPVRHSLGALLLEQGRLADAEVVYRKDLQQHPANGWALKGLAECYHRSGRHSLAEETDRLFAAAWARSDIAIKASCYCRTRFEM